MKSPVSAILARLKFSRFYYRFTKETIEQHGSRLSQFYYLLDWLLFVGVQPHIFLYVYIMYNDYRVCLWYNFRQYDVLLNFYYENQHVIGAFVPLVTYLFGLCIILFSTCLYRLNVNTITWQWWHQLVVLNQDRYIRSMFTGRKMKLIVASREKRLLLSVTQDTLLGSLVPGLIMRLYCKLRTKWDIFVHLDNVNKEKLFREPLAALPNLSHKLRANTLVLLTIADWYACVYQIGHALLFWTVLLGISFYINFEPFPWYIIVFDYFKMFIVYYILLQVIRNTLFFVYCSMLGTYVYSRHVIGLTRKATKLIGQFGQRRGGIPLRCCLILAYLLKEHNRVCYLAIRSNHELFCWITLVFVLVGVPLNVYLISLNVFNSQSATFLLILWFIIIFESYLTLLLFTPLAHLCKVFHSPKRFIPQLQALIRGNGWLWYKLKYDNLYGRLRRGTKLAMSVGPADSITYRAMFEFVLVYVGYLLTAFSTQIDLRLEKMAKEKL